MKVISEINLANLALEVNPDNNVLLLFYTNKSPRPSKSFIGPLDAVPFSDLSRMKGVVLSDKEDPINTATVQSSGSEMIHRLRKGNTAALQNLLKGTVASQQPYQGQEKYAFDHQFILDKVVYDIDTTTGIFSKTENDVSTLFQVDENLISALRHDMNC